MLNSISTKSITRYGQFSNLWSEIALSHRLVENRWCFRVKRIQQSTASEWTSRLGQKKMYCFFTPWIPWVEDKPPGQTLNPRTHHNTRPNVEEMTLELCPSTHQMSLRCWSIPFSKTYQWNHKSISVLTELSAFISLGHYVFFLF